MKHRAWVFIFPHTSTAWYQNKLQNAWDDHVFAPHFCPSMLTHRNWFTVCWFLFSFFSLDFFVALDYGFDFISPPKFSPGKNGYLLWALFLRSGNFSIPYLNMLCIIETAQYKTNDKTSTKKRVIQQQSIQNKEGKNQQPFEKINFAMKSSTKIHTYEKNNGIRMRIEHWNERTSAVNCLKQRKLIISSLLVVFLQWACKPHHLLQIYYLSLSLSCSLCFKLYAAAAHWPIFTQANYKHWISCAFPRNALSRF